MMEPTEIKQEVQEDQQQIANQREEEKENVKQEQNSDSEDEDILDDDDDDDEEEEEDEDWSEEEDYGSAKKGKRKKPGRKPKKIPNFEDEDKENGSMEFAADSGNDSDADIVYYVCVENATSWMKKELAKNTKGYNSRRKLEVSLDEGCKVCGKKYDNLHTLRGHMKRKHFFGVYNCANCQNFRCEFAGMLFNHYKDDGCGDTFECPNRRCDLMFSRDQTLDDFSEHFKTHSPNFNRKPKPAVCDICGQWMSSKHALWRHVNAHKGIKPLKCDECDFSTTHANSLKDHKTIHLRERGIEQFICDQCGKSFFNKYQLNEHTLNIHMGMKGRHICKYCGERFTYQSSLKRHKAKHHSNKQAICHICGYVAAFNTDLKRHYRIHVNDANLTEEELNKLDLQLDSKVHVCETCGYTAGTPNDLRRHERVHQEGQYPCSFCGKKLKSPGSLASHERSHTGEKPYSCEVCGETFINTKERRKHQIQKHGDGPQFQCEECDYKAYTPGQIKRHQVAHREGDFACKYCGKRLKSRKAIRNHELGHTEEGKMQRQQERREKGEECPCRYCGKVLYSIRSREDHERLHTGEKPFECETCKISFYSTKELNRHKNQVHSENPRERKSYTCEICGKVCTRSCAYKDHMNSHRGIKAHKCEDCDYTATHRTALYIHKKKHVKE